MKRQRLKDFLGTSFGIVAAASVGAGLAVSDAAAQSLRDSFVNSITVKGIKQHQQSLQEIADANDGTRAAGTPGFRQSVTFIRQTLLAAGYDAVLQPFAFTQFIETHPPVFEVASGSKTYTPDVDFATMSYSGNGQVKGKIVPAGGIQIPANPTPPPNSASGCDPADFPAETAGNIALIQRGTCTFFTKATNAIAAGAVGVVIFNEGNASDPSRQGLLFGTLGEQVSVPVIGTSYDVGVELYSSTTLNYRLKVSAKFVNTQAYNVIADTPGGDPDHVVVVGAHLDSVPAGPGINDNGSGSATILEIARQMSLQHITPVNKVRFAFWGAEEEGLLGSTYYVGTLDASEVEKIALNLNFDMLASPNFVRFVYDGNGKGGVGGTKGPKGSAEIEKVFLSYFRSQSLPTAPTAFDGRSDYGPFIEVGIPAGGLFSGAEGIKTRAEAKKFGGKAGVAYDSCYHQACDTIKNLNNTSLLQLGRGTADSVFYWATRTDPLPAAQANERLAIARIADDFDYSGPKLKR